MLSFPWRVQTEAPNTLLVFHGLHQVPLDLLGHVAQVAEKLSQQPGHIEEPSPGLNTARNQQLWGNLLDGQSNTPK